MLSNYLLFEDSGQTADLKKIPSHVLETIIKIGEEYDNIKELEQHIDEFIRLRPEFQSGQLKKIIDQKKLIPILSWGNGDHLFYSIKKNKFYTYNHETDKFQNAQHEYKELKKGLQ